ncbi:MAG: thiamine phosphate synthase [Pseudomonadota bacterium]
MDQPAIDEEEAEPRFLLTGPGPGRADAVAAVLAALQPAGLIVGGGLDAALLEVSRGHGVALLVEDEVDLEADGVHLTDPGRCAEIRAKLDLDPKNRFILGADAGLSRHEAMVAGEAGADYIGFGDPGISADDEVLERVDWWRSITILPCLAYAEDIATVKKLARLGADFIGVSSAVWKHPDGSVAAAGEMAAAIEKN